MLVSVKNIGEKRKEPRNIQEQQTPKEWISTTYSLYQFGIYDCVLLLLLLLWRWRLIDWSNVATDWRGLLLGHHVHVVGYGHA